MLIKRIAFFSVISLFVLGVILYLTRGDSLEYKSAEKAIVVIFCGASECFGRTTNIEKWEGHPGYEKFINTSSYRGSVGGFKEVGPDFFEKLNSVRFCGFGDTTVENFFAIYYPDGHEAGFGIVPWPRNLEDMDEPNFLINWKRGLMHPCLKNDRKIFLELIFDILE